MNKKPTPKPEEPKRTLGRNPGGEHSSEQRMARQVKPNAAPSATDQWCAGTDKGESH